MFSGGIKGDQWHEMGEILEIKLSTDLVVSISRARNLNILKLHTVNFFAQVKLYQNVKIDEL